MAPKCPYCHKPSQLVPGNKVYRSDKFTGKLFYICHPCQAWVGCHPGTDKPLGRLADKQLRDAKMKAHAAFDPIWRENKMKRSTAYAWLAEQLGIDVTKCHIGMFDLEQCERVVEVCLKVGG